MKQKKKALAELMHDGSLPAAPTWWTSEGSGVVKLGDDRLGRWMKRHLTPFQYRRALAAFKFGRFRYTPWYHQLRFLLDTFGREAADGVGKVGNRTYSNRSLNLFAAFELLTAQLLDIDIGRLAIAAH